MKTLEEMKLYKFTCLDKRDLKRFIDFLPTTQWEAINEHYN